MNRYFYLVNPWWEKKKFNFGTVRSTYLNQLLKDFDNRPIQILTGLRRVGKSTIALQLIHKVLQTRSILPSQILFFSIEDPSINNISIIHVINEFRAEHNLKSKTKIYVFIDEIQFRENWEQEIKSIYDSENIKFVLTGSSAILLSDKLSYLTGRYIKTQIFPLTFKEYLNFKKIVISKSDDFLIQKYLEDYLQTGGMPEYVLNKINRYLETTVESILFKDLVSKFQLRNPKILTDLIYLLSDRVGSTSSSLKISNIIDINKDTVLTYLDYLNKTFITSQLNNYSTSRNKEIYNPPKIYFEDTGICNIYSSKTNIGALAENAIYNHLKINIANQLRTKIGYWFEDQKELDFIISKNTEMYFIESKWVDDIAKIDISSLEKALESNTPKKVFYLTKNLKHKIIINSLEINFIPLREFLLKDFSGFVEFK